MVHFMGIYSTCIGYESWDVRQHGPCEPKPFDFDLDHTMSLSVFILSIPGCRSEALRFRTLISIVFSKNTPWLCHIFFISTNSGRCSRESVTQNDGIHSNSVSQSHGFHRLNLNPIIALLHEAKLEVLRQPRIDTVV